MNDLPESLEQIESMVASARNYVRPSENLRPRILETARAQQSHRLGTRRMFQLAALIVLGVLLTIPAQEHLDSWRRSALSPSAGELEMQAQKYAEQPASARTGPWSKPSKCTPTATNQSLWWFDQTLSRWR